MKIVGIICNAQCGQSITWAADRGGKLPTKDVMEQEARNRGWHAPDRLGRHWCPAHRMSPQPTRKGARS